MDPRDAHLAPSDFRAAVFQRWDDTHQERKVIEHLAICALCSRNVDEERKENVFYQTFASEQSKK